MATSSNKARIVNHSDFWTAVRQGDVGTVRHLLEKDESLAGKNFKPESLHSDGFPLYHAAKHGNLELCKLLLDAGADADAKLNIEDPREKGMPLINALQGNHFDIVNLLLDHDTDLNAHGYCSTPFVDQLFNRMWDTNIDYEAGERWQYKNDSSEIVTQLFRQSFASYFGESSANAHRTIDGVEPSVADAVGNGKSSSLELLSRVVEMGGQPSLFTTVRHEQPELIDQLLKHHAGEPGTEMDWPKGTVFDNICYGASWCGYPKTLDIARASCPDLFTADVAKRAIERAIRSHNRDGGIDQYAELIHTQLEFLKQQQALDETYSSGEPFLPLHWLTVDFIETSHYGFKCEELSTQDDLLRLAKLFFRFGFENDSIEY